VTLRHKSGKEALLGTTRRLGLAIRWRHGTCPIIMRQMPIGGGEPRRNGNVTPEELTCRLNNLYAAADVVEAIDNPELQQERGWDLSRWRYDLVPWGVRFTYLDPLSRCNAEVLAVMAAEV
jgi:hypothetical protein